jgi:Tol biopolymer transport system component
MLTTVPRIVSVSYRYTSLYVFDLVEGYDVQVTPDEIKVRDHVWSPNGNSLAVSGHLEDINQDGKIDQDDPAWLYTISLPDYTIECVDAAKEIEDSRLEPSWSADGRYLAYLGNRDELVVLDAMTYEEITRFEIDPGSKAYHWAPDSARIAYVGTSSWPDSVHLFVDLFIFDLETSTHIRLTNTSTYTIYGVYERNGVQLDHPLWSPDGKQIAIMWRTGDQEYLVVSKADGSQLTKVTKLEHYYRLVAWVKKEN